MKTFAAVTLLALAGCLGTHKPETQFGAGLFGWNFSDTKDNDISIKNFKVDPATKVLSFDEFTIRNNASDPMTAFIGQMQMQVEYNKVQLEKLDRILSAVEKVVPHAP